MQLLFFIRVFWILQLCSYLGETLAKPLNPDVIELRIRRDADPNILKSKRVPYVTMKETYLDNREATFLLPTSQVNATTLIILEHLLAIHRQKREANIFQDRQRIEQREDDGKKNCNNKKKKYKMCSGLYKMFWNIVTKRCELCEGGKQPSEKGDKCVDPETPEQEKERGRCPLGKKLDPNVPGQDHTTLNPKCVDRDQQNRCPGGQSESTPTKSRSQKCAPDSEPNKRCDKKDTYAHKEIGPDGNMRTTCRTTNEKAKEQKEKVKAKIREAGNKIMEPINKAKAEREEKKKKARARRSACLALGAIAFLADADVQALGELELEGLIEPDDQSYAPDVDIEDYMVTIKPHYQAKINGVLESGPNLGALIKALVKFFRGGGGPAATRPSIPATAPSRLFGGPGKGELSGSKMFTALRDKKSSLNTKSARPEAKAAASKSNAVQNILKSKSFQDCLAVGAGAVLGASVARREEHNSTYEDDDVIINLNAAVTNQFPSPDWSDQMILLVADDTTDAGEDEDPDLKLRTYQDGYLRGSRLYYEGCGNLASIGKSNSITLLQTWNGCCKYYNGEHCEPETGLFKQTDREDGQLKGASNDAVSSFWCTFDANCAGAPGG